MGLAPFIACLQRVGLATSDCTPDVRVLKVHQPYYESDHVLNIAYNLLCDGEHAWHDIEVQSHGPWSFSTPCGRTASAVWKTAGDFRQPGTTEELIDGPDGRHQRHSA